MVEQKNNSTLFTRAICTYCREVTEDATPVAPEMRVTFMCQECADEEFEIVFIPGK